MNAVKSNQRIKWIDIAKGIGIILVVLGHSPRDEMRVSFLSIEYMYQIIYTFHMGLFFFISGYIYYNNKNKKNNELIKAIKTLLVPWIAYTLIIYLLFYSASLIPYFKNVLGNQRVPFYYYLFQSFSGNNPYSFHLWFIYVLFFINVIIYFYNRIIKKESFKKYYILIVISFTLYIIFKKIFLISFIFRFLIFFNLGILFKKNEKFTKKNNGVYILLGSILLSIFFIFLEKSISNNTLIYSIINNFRIYIISYILILSIINISYTLNSNKMLEYLGKNSYNIYLLHQPFCCGFVGILLLKFLRLNFMNSIIIMIICFLISFILPLLFMYIVSKCKLSKLMNKIFNLKYFSYNK